MSCNCNNQGEDINPNRLMYKYVTLTIIVFLFVDVKARIKSMMYMTDTCRILLACLYYFIIIDIYRKIEFLKFLQLEILYLGQSYFNKLIWPLVLIFFMNITLYSGDLLIFHLKLKSANYKYLIDNEVEEIFCVAFKSDEKFVTEPWWIFKLLFLFSFFFFF